ncbi:hypothetical protein AT6N2_C1544 [Agrobacterium tumefaciens]|nr:hypothetical protein AT6N2_C1544 [Agrobacterium tumefaciens]
MPCLPENAACERRFQIRRLFLQTVGLVAGAAIGAERLHGRGNAGLVGGHIGENRIGVRPELDGLGLEIIEIFPDGRRCRAAGLGAGGKLVRESLGIGADGCHGSLDGVRIKGLLALGDRGKRTHGATDLLHHAFALFDFAGSVDRSGAKTAEQHGRRDGFQFHTLSP